MKMDKENRNIILSLVFGLIIMLCAIYHISSNSVGVKNPTPVVKSLLDKAKKENLKIISVTEVSNNSFVVKFTDNAWIKYKLNDKGDETHVSCSNGFNANFTYWMANGNGKTANVVYSNGSWEKAKWDINGVCIYMENSEDGVVVDVEGDKQRAKEEKAKEAISDILTGMMLME